MKKISILGSTGSIGQQTVDICRNHENFQVTTVTANQNVELLAEQAKILGVKKAIIGDEKQYGKLKLALKDTFIIPLCGKEEIARSAFEDDSEVVVNAIVGIAGLESSLAVLSAGKDLALANKESLVAGGELVMKLAKEKNSRILPVDSEHSAIFQCLNGENWDTIERVLLTASGGPFFGYSKERLLGVTKAEALKHPNWEMGAKITIDSATLMNKGLEFIEAMHLFSLTPEQIQVVIHRQSILHSAVEFKDGSVIAQLGASDMRIPIQYALTYPERLPCPAKKLDLFTVGQLDFSAPDLETFLCLRSAIEAAKRGGLWAAALNGANEEAVSAFLDGKMSYYNLFEVAERVLSEITPPESISIAGVYEADQMGRELAKGFIK